MSLTERDLKFFLMPELQKLRSCMKKQGFLLEQFAVSNHELQTELQWNSSRDGRKPIANGNERRKLCQIALKNPLKPANFLKTQLEYRGDPTLSVRSVQRYLHESGIVKLLPKPVLDLTPVQKQKRIDFCDQHMNDDFTTTFFTDEANFSFHRMQVKRWSAGKPREIPRPKFPKTLMIWGGISTMGPTNISIIRGT